MKKPRFALATISGFLATTSVLNAQVVINELLYDPIGTDYGSEKLELKNVGTSAVNLSNYVLCTSFFYSDPGDFAGINLAPGQILTVHLAFPGTNDANNLYLPNFLPVIPQIFSGTLSNGKDEISIYDCNPFCDFGGLGADNRMVDYVQWGTAGAGPNEERHDVAADPTRAGGALWSAVATFDFAPVATEGQSIAFDGTNGGGGELTLGSDYRLVAPTIGQNNGCFADADCNDNITCTDNHCMAGQCMFVANNSLCASNGLFCDGAEVCQVGTGCVSAGSPCPIGQFCNESTDTCSACQTNANCNDNSACTVDTCSNGTCVFTPVAGCCISNAGCNDLNPCTTDLCTNSVCQYLPVDDCQSCTTDNDCDDDEPCTVDECESGQCGYTFSTADCNDGDSCTGDDQCEDGACVGQPIENCCVVDSDCNDDDECTVDSCENSICQFIAEPDCQACEVSADCDDSNPCTDEICETGRCTFANNNVSCSDGDLCTVEDICIDGVCEGTAATNCCTSDLQCDDDDDCTTDTCNMQVCRFTIIADCEVDVSGGQDVPDDGNQDSDDSASSRGVCGSMGLITAAFLFLGLARMRSPH